MLCIGSANSGVVTHHRHKMPISEKPCSNIVTTAGFFTWWHLCPWFGTPPPS